LVGIDLDITERVAAAERENVLQQQLRDASRQAGMAEVATSVLHNVGNVLNSVNVSANLVTGTVKRSRAPVLDRVVALLREHEADLGRFISEDQRGKVLPVYLAELSRQLSLDQQATLQELESLKSNVDHIKEIVSMQQRYAKLSGVTETIDLTRHVTIGVGCCEAGVRVAVADTGIGISPDNMPRLFTHGFTTKRGGHGFGLHSGALAAKELGGTLRALSDGIGLGATFILELPIGSAEHAHG
jgi:light-regulated signal transduction histidine kinase (bacteriophytochrome)